MWWFTLLYLFLNEVFSIHGRGHWHLSNEHHSLSLYFFYLQHDESSGILCLKYSSLWTPGRSSCSVLMFHQRAQVPKGSLKLQKRVQLGPQGECLSMNWLTLFKFYLSLIISNGYEQTSSCQAYLTERGFNADGSLCHEDLPCESRQLHWQLFALLSKPEGEWIAGDCLALMVRHVPRIDWPHSLSHLLQPPASGEVSRI